MLGIIGLAFVLGLPQALAAYLVHKDNWAFESSGDELYGPSIIKVEGSSDKYAVVYQTSGARDGFVKTFAMHTDNDGKIVKTMIADYNFNDPGKYARIFHIAGTTYALVYTLNNNQGWIQTFTINTDGTIPQSDLAYLAKSQVATDAKTIDMVRVVGATNIFALVYQGPSSNGSIRTVEIDAAGAITWRSIGVLPPGSSSFQFLGTNDLYTPRISNIPGTNNYVIVYGTRIKARALTILYNSVTQFSTVILLGPSPSTMENGSRTPSKPVFVSTQGAVSIFVVAYQGQSNVGKIRTFGVDRITGVVTFSSPPYTNIQFDPLINTKDDIEPALDLQSLGGSSYGIAYEARVETFPGSGEYNFFVRFDVYTINPTGSSIIQSDNSVSLPSSSGTPASPTIMPINGNPYYMIVYSGLDEDGFVQTFAPSTYIDCGLHVWDANSVVAIACESGSATSPLRIWDGSAIYGIVLVDTANPSASKIHIWTGTTVMALMKMP